MGTDDGSSRVANGDCCTYHNHQKNPPGMLNLLMMGKIRKVRERRRAEEEKKKEESWV
jgi:hypothetical protein